MRWRLRSAHRPATPSASGCGRRGRGQRCAAMWLRTTARARRRGARSDHSCEALLQGFPPRLAAAMLRPIAVRGEGAMPGTDAALLTAEEMLALYARRALSP